MQPSTKPARCLRRHDHWASPGPDGALTRPFGATGSPTSPAIPYPISYLRAGTVNGPRLMLVHGTPGSANSWADYLMDVPPGWEVVALDRPGFGRSGPEVAVVGLAEQAAAVAALIPADGRPVVLLGHSLGGPVVPRVAVGHPGRIAALVMLAASLDPELEEIHPMQYVGAWAPVRSLLPRVLRNANAELLALKSELEILAPMLRAIMSRVVALVHALDARPSIAHRAIGQCSGHVLRDARTFAAWRRSGGLTGYSSKGLVCHLGNSTCTSPVSEEEGWPHWPRTHSVRRD